MKDEINLQVQRDLEELKEVTEGIHQQTSELKEQVQSIKEAIDELVIEKGGIYTMQIGISHSINVSQLAKMKKVHSLHVPAITIIG